MELQVVCSTWGIERKRRLFPAVRRDRYVRIPYVVQCSSIVVVRVFVLSPSETWSWGMSVGGLPAGVGLDSPSRDSSPGCLRDSVGRLTRGGGLVVRGWCIPPVRLVRALMWCSSGGGGTRGAGCTVAESLVRAPQDAQAYRGMLYRVSKTHIR